MPRSQDAARRVQLPRPAPAHAATTTPAPLHSPSLARPHQSPQTGAPVPHKISCTPRTSADARPHRRPANPLRSPAPQSICPDTLRSSSQFLRQLLPRKKQPRFHRAHRNSQHPRNFFQRVPLNPRQQHHQSKLFRQLFHRPLQPRLKFARRRQLFHRRPRRSMLRRLPIASRASRAVSPNANDPAPSGTQSAPANRETAPAPAAGSKFRYAFSSASCATSSASAACRKTPYATRNASGPHSASRSSNSR